MKKTITIGFLLLALLALTGCAPAGYDTPTTQPSSTQWSFNYGYVNRIEDEEYGVVCYVLGVSRGGDLECFTMEGLNGEQ